jgi:hypothetical protein
MALSFDPKSPGARRLARTWVPHLERWELRMTNNRRFIDDDGRVIEPGQTVEVGGPHGRELVERGSAELVGVRLMSASE